MTAAEQREALKQMALVMVLARLQAEGRALKDLSEIERDAIIKEVVEDLQLTNDVNHEVP